MRKQNKEKPNKEKSNKENPNKENPNKEKQTEQIFKKHKSKGQATKQATAQSFQLYGELSIAENQLERFENRTLIRKYTIDFTCPEFTCLCPRSGFPDFASIHIRYIPDLWCVELKSLKLYINGFRNKKIFHEDVTNIILQDLIELLEPWEITVTGDFHVRGNIKTVVTASHTKSLG